ncbi:septin family p-loop gtpase [Moniliophthora roreri]|nr:septin family p-loop gtpase [Moniliophthora roreri]
MGPWTSRSSVAVTAGIIELSTVNHDGIEGLGVQGEFEIGRKRTPSHDNGSNDRESWQYCMNFNVSTKLFQISLLCNPGENRKKNTSSLTRDGHSTLASHFYVWRDIAYLVAA